MFEIKFKIEDRVMFNGLRNGYKYLNGKIGVVVSDCVYGRCEVHINNDDKTIWMQENHLQLVDKCPYCEHA